MEKGDTVMNGINKMNETTAKRSRPASGSGKERRV